MRGLDIVYLGPLANRQASNTDAVRNFTTGVTCRKCEEKFNRSSAVANLPCKCRANPFGSFWVKLLTQKQTNNNENLSSLAEIIISNQDIHTI